MPISIHLNELDTLLARKIQPQGGYFSQFICQAYSCGHTAVRYQNGSLYPKVSQVCTLDGREYLSAAEIEQIECQICNELESHAFSHCVQDGPYIALPSAYAIEKSIAQEIVRLQSHGSPYRLKPVSFSLNEQQLSAVEGALKATISTITGGPGTGKTFTAGILLSQLIQSSATKLHVALLAPTGRAVKNLYASIIRFFTQEQAAVLEAKTIHRALGGKCAYLPYNVVIVDEASMIDAHLMLQLLRRLHEGTKLIFLGDTNQLPSIDPGQPFFDMIAAHMPLVPNFRLETCVRTENVTLKNLAASTISGNDREFFEIVRTPCDQLSFIDLDLRQYAEVTELIQETVFEPWQGVRSLNEAQPLIASKALLCAVRKGPFGSETLNHLGEAYVRSQFAPIISTENNYQIHVMNSDLGTLDRASNLAYFPEATIPAILCPGIESAYAMTVHKSQGSEFDTVIVAIAPHTECSPRLLYTAITRAKKKVILIASSTALKEVLQQRYQRESVLAYACCKGTSSP